jgi:ZIP family zinc transporter
MDLANLNPILQAFLATLFTWGMTALGAALVFVPILRGQKTLDVMLGFAAGVMTAASYWSLLAPAIAMSEDMGAFNWVPALIGFVLGAGFLNLVDIFLPHLHPEKPKTEAEGVPTSWQRSTLLVLAITLHNIPEGLAIGVAFGAAAAGLPSATVAGALALAIGIGIQNFPEGTAVSVPLRREGVKPGKAFWYGQLSGMVEPLAAVLGAAVVLLMRPALPYALAFAAGAMIYVVVEEVIPSAHGHGHGNLATFGFIGGFSVMMTLDVALG